MKRIDHRLALGIVMLIGFALRVARLDFQPLWWDEGYSLFFATRDFATMLERTAIDIHPPLYYVLLRLWMAVFGESDVALRTLSAVVGAAAIPLTYALARKLFANGRVALIAALLLALSPLHVYYSQEVRMYGLVTLLGMASVYLFVHLLELPRGQPGAAPLEVAYVLVTAAALHTQYYAAFILSVEIVAFVVLAVRRSPLLARPTTQWLGAWGAVAVLYLPWAIYAGPKLYDYVTAKVAHEGYAPLDPISFLGQHLTAFSTGHLTDWTGLAWGGVVVTGLALFGVAATTGKVDSSPAPRLARASALLLVILYLLVPLALGYLVNLRFPFHPIHNERLLLLAAPAFYLLAALGISRLWDRRALLGVPAVVIVAIVFGGSLYDLYSVPRYLKDDYRPLIQELQYRSQSGDIFLATFPWQIGYLESYYHGGPLTVVEVPSAAWVNDPSRMMRDLDALLAQHPRVWLPALQALGHVVEDAVESNLRARAYVIFDDWFGTTRLEYFALAGDPPRAARTLSFEGGVAFSNWGISTDPVVAGQDLVRMWFDSVNGASGDLKASLRLVDQKGNLWAQDDRGVDDGMQRIGFVPPLGTPPGEYDLRLAIYRARDNSPLHLISGEEDASLGHVQVVAPVQPNLGAIPHRTQVDFANGMRLLGYDAASPVRPGVPAAITLFWQADRGLDREYAISLQIQDALGNVYASTQAAPARGIHPTTRWQPGEIVRDPQTFTLRGDAPDGVYRIVIAPVASNSTWTAPEIGTLTVKGRPHYFGAPVPSKSFDARFGSVARLIGYDLNSDRRAARLVLYWQALASSATSYTAFAHLVDETGALRAQRDQIPGGGAYPTTTWVTGEYLIDVYDIPMPRHAPAGQYDVRIGFYDGTTGARLVVFDAQDRQTGEYIVLPSRISVAP